MEGGRQGGNERSRGQEVQWPRGQEEFQRSAARALRFLRHASDREAEHLRCDEQEQESKEEHAPQRALELDVVRDRRRVHRDKGLDRDPPPRPEVHAREGEGALDQDHVRVEEASEVPRGTCAKSARRRK